MIVTKLNDFNPTNVPALERAKYAEFVTEYLGNVKSISEEGEFEGEFTVEFDSGVTASILPSAGWYNGIDCIGLNIPTNKDFALFAGICYLIEQNLV